MENYEIVTFEFNENFGTIKIYILVNACYL